MLQTLTKPLTAAILCIALGLTSLAPAPAMAGNSDDDALAGLIALLLFGVAVHELRDRDRVTHPAPTPSRPAADWRILPENCLRTVIRANGERIRFFGQRCLNNNYAYVDSLPERCHVRFRTINDQRRQGFRPNCLRN
ncbi:MAG: hypothetical protein AAGL89_15605, partial [Pseudomonadota bacterium]